MRKIVKFFGFLELLVAAGLWLLASAALCEDEAAGKLLAERPLYERKATWPETMLALREAVARYDAIESNYKPFASEVLHSKQPAQRFSAPIAGWRHLWILVSNTDDGTDGDHAVWGEPLLVAQDGSTVRLRDLDPLTSSSSVAVLRDRSPENQPLRVGDRTFEHGLWMHSNGVAHYLLDRDYERIEGWIGNMYTEDARGDVQFRVVGWRDPVPEFSRKIGQDFPKQWNRFTADMGGDWQTWFRQGDSVELERKALERALEEVGSAGDPLNAEFKTLTLAQAPANGPAWLDLYERVTAARDRLRVGRALLRDFHPESLRLAIADLMETYPERYADGGDFLSALENCGARLSQAEKDAVETEADETTETAFARLADEMTALQRRVALRHPLVCDNPIVYIVRHQYRSSFHAIDTLFHTNEYNTELFQGPGAMKVIDFAKDGETRTLVEEPEGVVRDPDVFFDASRIVFAIRKNIQEDYRIWEINADGAGLKQLTHATGVSDFDPIYLPDGDIVFSSTREPKYNMCSRDIAANLFRMTGDGANIHQITKNTLFDNHSALLPDGRILYARWEYVDRNFGDAHSLWTVNPDGTNQAIYWGNNTAVPGAAFSAHIIPGTQQIVSVLGPHHDRLWGALAIIDRRLAIDGRPAFVRVWPEASIDWIRAGGGFDCDRFAYTDPKYADPWPLDANYFLCSRTIGKGEQTGIYLIDRFGNETLLHTEEPGCYDPMPLKPRPRPQDFPARRDFQSDYGTFYVADVYAGTHMQGVARGAARRLRVVESPPKQSWSEGLWNGQGYTAPGMNWHSLENKRILGSVPIEADGSAYFRVPQGKFVYFQLLDSDGMMIQSMRSGTVLQPGEQTGCVGCHDNRLGAPPALQGKMPLALAQPPRNLEPWHGEARTFGYTAEVQPVFDKHCVRCHDFGKKAGEKLVLAGDRDIAFNASYTELWRKRYINCIGAGPAEIQEPYSWGSHASKLVEVLRKGHQNVELTGEDFDRIVTWLDLNGVYYPEYTCAYPDSRTGRCPLDTDQLTRLAKLTQVDILGGCSYGTNAGPQICFERPALSPCLSHIEDRTGAEYKEALALIETGREMLARRPRADMPGFQPCEVDQRRLDKYARRQVAEQRSWEAIREGRKVFDETE